MKTTIRSMAAVFTIASGFALAAPVAMAQADMGMKVCDGKMQDRKACMAEVNAAKQAAKRNNLTSAAPDMYMKNAMQRCLAQPPAERSACEARISGAGQTKIDGSVMGGGVIRETVTPVPAR